MLCSAPHGAAASFQEQVLEEQLCRAVLSLLWLNDLNLLLEELENVPTSCQLRGEWGISDEEPLSSLRSKVGPALHPARTWSS